jgi:phosphatidate cytidylyltransferase
VTGRSLLLTLVMAACVAVFSNAGDLMESVRKRRCGVKDSGKLLPGHGGVLDRFDGVLLSVPVIVAYLQLVNR